MIPNRRRRGALVRSPGRARAGGLAGGCTSDLHEQKNFPGMAACRSHKQSVKTKTLCSTRHLRTAGIDLRTVAPTARQAGRLTGCSRIKTAAEVHPIGAPDV